MKIKMCYQVSQSSLQRKESEKQQLIKLKEEIAVKRELQKVTKIRGKGVSMFVGLRISTPCLTCARR